MYIKDGKPINLRLMQILETVSNIVDFGEIFGQSYYITIDGKIHVYDNNQWRLIEG